MKKLLGAIIAALVIASPAFAASPPWKTSYGPGFQTEGGGGGGGYPALKSPCSGFAQGYCINSAGKVVPCVCIKWEVCGIWTFIWMPVNIA